MQQEQLDSQHLSEEMAFMCDSALIETVWTAGPLWSSPPPCLNSNSGERAAQTCLVRDMKVITGRSRRPRPDVQGDTPAAGSKLFPSQRAGLSDENMTEGRVYNVRPAGGLRFQRRAWNLFCWVFMSFRVMAERRSDMNSLQSVTLPAGEAGCSGAACFTVGFTDDKELCFHSFIQTLSAVWSPPLFLLLTLTYCF